MAAPSSVPTTSIKMYMQLSRRTCSYYFLLKVSLPVTFIKGCTRRACICSSLFFPTQSCIFLIFTFWNFKKCFPRTFEISFVFISSFYVFVIKSNAKIVEHLLKWVDVLSNWSCLLGATLDDVVIFKLHQCWFWCSFKYQFLITCLPTMIYITILLIMLVVVIFKGWVCDMCMDVYSDVAPSQGGRYSGFGYTMDPPPRSASQEFFDNAVTSLSSFSQQVNFLSSKF